MIIGVPKEVKVEEYRVGLIPEFVRYLVKKGHKVYVQKDAGSEAGFLDEQYIKAGAQIVKSIGELYKNAELIIKVKEPQEEEIQLIREGQTLFTFFHFSSNKKMTMQLIEKKQYVLPMNLSKRIMHYLS